MENKCRYVKTSKGYRSECGHTIKSVSHTFKYCPFCGGKYIRSRKDYYEENKEQIKAKSKAYRQEHKEQCLEYAKEWRKKNPNYYKRYAMGDLVNG